MTAPERLAAHTTNLDRPVYALRGLPPEVVAVLFAQVSRSAAGFRENLLKLMEEDDLPVAAPAHGGFDQAKASAFHEKWVLGYGHSSVAEHAALHLAVEEISILAAKALEEARLASFTEKSSRYQVFDAGRFHVPAEWRGLPEEAEALALVEELYACYARIYSWRLQELEALGRPAALGERAWRQALHAGACDTARYLLPAGARTSLGMSLNARSLAHLIRRLRAHGLQELRQLGDALEAEGRQITPVLLKHAQPTDFQRKVPDLLRQVLAPHSPAPATWDAKPLPRVRVLDSTPDGERKVVADWICQSQGLPLDAARQAAMELSQEQCAGIFQHMLAGRGPHDPAPRAFEHAAVTVEFCLDYGAFRDLQRHRLCSQTLSSLGCQWGWELPDELAQSPWKEELENLLQRVTALWERLAAQHDEAAAYLVPLAFRYRFVMHMNLREADHLIRLRSTPAGHSSYRRAAWDLLHGISAHFPLLGPYLQEAGRVEESQARQGLARAEEVARESARRAN